MLARRHDGALAELLSWRADGRAPERPRGARAALFESVVNGGVRRDTRTAHGRAPEPTVMRKTAWSTCGHLQLPQAAQADARFQGARRSVNGHLADARPTASRWSTATPTANRLRWITTGALGRVTPAMDTTATSSQGAGERLATAALDDDELDLPHAAGYARTVLHPTAVRTSQVAAAHTGRPRAHIDALGTLRHQSSTRLPAESRLRTPRRR